MPAQGHILNATDAAFAAFFKAANLPLDSAQIVPNKNSADKTLPVLICAADAAARKRAKNYAVTGSIILKTDPTTADNADNLDASTALEKAVLDALENIVPADDRPQPLADSIQTAAIAASAVTAGQFLITDCRITNVSQGFDEDEIWTFTVDYAATVIA